VVLIVGFGPGAEGCVFIFYKADEFAGTRLLILNWIKAFLIGRIPGD